MGLRSWYKREVLHHGRTVGPRVDLQGVADAVEQRLWRRQVWCAVMALVAWVAATPIVLPHFPAVPFLDELILDPIVPQLPEWAVLPAVAVAIIAGAIAAVLYVGATFGAPRLFDDEMRKAVERAAESGPAGRQ